MAGLGGDDGRVWLCSFECEEHTPSDLVRYAQRAEEASFTFALISDHHHPWLDRQGNSPLCLDCYWCYRPATGWLSLGTSVTCPTMRIHPAIIAQAAATAAAIMPGRFFFGVGAGENLNEHILGGHWPLATVRLEMLEEAIAVIRLLWQGGWQSHRGRYYTVEDARIYTLPDELPPIVIAAGGLHTAAIAGRISDGFISTLPNPELVEAFVAAGGAGKPRYSQVKVCWARDESEARRIAHKQWPVEVLGALLSELSLPEHFEQAAKFIDEEDVTNRIICGPDSERHIAAIRKYIDAGYDHIYVHQIGPDQEGFFDFYSQKLLPNL